MTIITLSDLKLFLLLHKFNTDSFYICDDVPCTIVVVFHKQRLRALFLSRKIKNYIKAHIQVGIKFEYSITL